MGGGDEGAAEAATCCMDTKGVSKGGSSCSGDATGVEGAVKKGSGGEEGGESNGLSQRDGEG